MQIIYIILLFNLDSFSIEIIYINLRNSW